MAKTRTFVGIALSPEAMRAAKSLAAGLQPHARGHRWVPDQNLHVSLQFLGDLTDTEVVEVCTQVGRAAAGFDPFAIELRGVGAFPSNDRPRTLWVGVAENEGQEILIDLQSEIEASLAQVGHRGENRRYVPHVTIGKSGRGPVDADATLTAKLEELADAPGALCVVNEATVFASELHRDGPAYHVLARQPLGGNK